MRHVEPQSDRTRLLITGAAGFVGSHLVRCALRDPAINEVVACDLKDSSLQVGVSDDPRLSCEVLDVRNLDDSLRVLRVTEPTHVIHAAAVTTGSEPQLLETNVQGTQNILAAISAQLSVRHLILLSSSGVYGSPTDEAPCNEDHPLDLRTPYAKSKYLAEQTLLEHDATASARLTVARIGPCFGLCESPGPYRPNLSLVARFLAAMQAEVPLRVAGEDYIRDWTHLDEIYRAMTRLLFAPELRHQIYNVSAGLPVSACELLHYFEAHGLIVEWTTAAYAHLLLRPEEGRKPLVIDRLCADTGFAPAMPWKQRIGDLIAHNQQPKNSFHRK